MSERILVTGGAGYVGSHACLVLLQAGYDVTVADNLVNSRLAALTRVQELAGRELEFRRVDIRRPRLVDALFRARRYDAVLHFAGLKAVNESRQRPLDYYATNVSGTINVLQGMARHGVGRIVFSSSCTVYDMRFPPPFTESSQQGSVTPYGWSKVMAERVLCDAATANPDLGVVNLRYFNPVGAHPSGRIGEDPRGIPNNLMPYIMQVLVGRRPQLSVFGADYDTPDGTCVRDFIHVMDLVEGHLSALRFVRSRPGCHAFNLGTGRGHSVMEVVEAAGRAAGRPVPHRLAPRRAGDVATTYADVTAAERCLDWRATRGLSEMCEDSLRWQTMNPRGYT